MSNENFNAGDIVQLKSGGPSMTVEGPDENDDSRIVCAWFEGKKRNVSSFLPVTLKKYEEQKKSLPRPRMI